jgi:hypothetical protein
MRHVGAGNLGRANAETSRQEWWNREWAFGRHRCAAIHEDFTVSSGLGTDDRRHDAVLQPNEVRQMTLEHPWIRGTGEQTPIGDFHDVEAILDGC